MRTSSWVRSVIGLVPLFAFIIIFEVVPVVGIIVSGFITQNKGSFTLRYFGQAFSRYLSSFITSSSLSAESAGLGCLVGLFIVFVLLTEQSPIFRRFLESFMAVTANFAGIPLAFAFMVSLGANGIMTNILRSYFHLHLYHDGFSLISGLGLVLVYSNFQIPLAVLVLLPTVSGLKQDWKEANSVLGGHSADYFFRIIVPIIMPSVIGVFLLLFANAFGAYATAYALAGGAINLVPIQIGFLINGNVSFNVNLGDAIATAMMVLLMTLVFFSTKLARLSSLWEVK